MNPHVYAQFAANLDDMLGNGITSSIDKGLAATTGPLTTLLILYVIFTGWLIMRGDMAARPGIFRVVRAGAVVMALSAAYFNPYIRDLFLTAIPDWVAGSLSSNGQVVTVPQQLDLIRSATLHMSATVYQHIGIDQIDVRLSAHITDGLVAFVLGLDVLIFAIAHAFTGLMLCVFPFVAAAYLFDATKGIVEGWIGKMISLSILTLLVSIMANIVVQADKAMLLNMLSGGAPDVEETVANLWSLAVFYTICTILLAGLPGIAYSIGRGVAINTSLGQAWASPARALDRIRIPARSPI